MRVLAVGDVHGCSGPLDALLEWVAPAADDTLVFLGDYVDRGPDSKGVLDRLIALKQAGRRVVCLRGNHEVMMLAARAGDPEAGKMWRWVGGDRALLSYARDGGPGTLADVTPAHWAFLDYNLLPYFETDTHIFVHAGVHADLDLDEQPDYMLYWEYLGDAMRHHSGKTVVCGHTSQRSGVPKVVPGAVCIDTNCAGGGWLTCLDAGTGRYWQTNLAGGRRQEWVEWEVD